ncbi:MAG: helix-turn-helix domain-containing protein [Thermodesulfobacteriota bacterium]|jgi:REP element-mobilizing transposase RayT
MARPLRVEFSGALYLATARSLPRQRLFRDAAEVEDFLSRLPELAAAFGVRCHAFCLLPNHYHLLLETPRPNLSRALHRLNAGYTAGVNARRGRRGPLLQPRYRALLLGEEWLVPLSVHVHLNPVRKRLAPDPWTYPGSSARAYAPGDLPLPGLTTQRVLGLSGGREAYVHLVEAARVCPPLPPWKQAWRGLVLGGEELRQRVLGALEGQDVREVPGFAHRPEGPSLEQVLEAVAEYTGLPTAQLTSGKFQRVLARKAAIYLARRVTGCTLREIGERFGVDYTTVHMAARRVEERRAQDPSLDALLSALETELRGGEAPAQVIGHPPVPAPEPPPPATPEPEPETPREPAVQPPESGPSRAPGRGRKGKPRGQLDLF